MRLASGWAIIVLWLSMLVACLSGVAVAAPDYVIAWPRQVVLEKPDPVLGDKPVWEHWVYGEAFAKRFKNFPIEGADAELAGSKLQAMVLRIFMTNIWGDLSPNYPQQYACEIDVYFDDQISLPISETGNPKKVFPVYPNGMYLSNQRLIPNAENDLLAIRGSRPVRTSLARQPLIFLTPFDGRFSQFGVREYYPSLVSGLAAMTLVSGFHCEVTAPLLTGGAHYLSLTGERPWDKAEDGPPKALHGRYDPRNDFIFDPGHNPEANGYFRVPRAFYNAALPKAALVKVLNWCIQKKHVHARPMGKAMSENDWKPIAHRCAEAEQAGNILPDPQYHEGKNSLYETGY